MRTYDLSPRSIGSEAHSLLLSSGASNSFDAAAQIACLRSLVEAVAAKLSGEATELRTQLEGALSNCGKVKDQVQLLQKQLHQQEVRLEQQQTQLQTQAKQQSAVALSDSMRTPAKKAPSVANSSSHSHHDLSGGNGMLTPVQRSSELAVTSRSSSAVKVAQHLNGSPAAKEAARLNAEVLREVRSSAHLCQHMCARPLSVNPGSIVCRNASSALSRSSTRTSWVCWRSRRWRWASSARPWRPSSRTASCSAWRRPPSAA